MERVYKVARWLPAVIVPIAIWWLFYTPTIGKAGLALAVVATLMPIAWEKSNGLLRSAWIATVFLLFFVEYAAINKAEADNRAAQAALLKEERNSFKAILDQGQTNFQSGMAQERGDFGRMMTDFATGQKLERQEFGTLLKKEDDLFTRQEQLAESLNGRLIPASDPTPENICPQARGDSVLLFLGDAADQNTVLVSRFPRTVVAIQGIGPAITLDRASDGSIGIVMDIRSRDRRLIARLTPEGFLINRNNFLEMRKAKSTLVIVDEYGNEVLNANYLNRNAFILKGVLTYPDRDPIPISFAPRMRHMCSNNAGSIDIMITP